MAVDKHEIEAYFRQLQDHICARLEDADGEGKFREDHWQRPGGGGGRSRVLQGRHIEKGGVNFSAVFGELPARQASALGLDTGAFFATGVSIVLHPRNPRAPIIHMNVRYFETEGGAWWFGGGIDLTPHYVIPEQARWFHRQLRNMCERHHVSYYPRFKTWADDYFFIRHRQETRGIGGIFFDRLSQEEGIGKEERFAFVQDTGELFCPLYVPLLEQNRDLEFGEREKHWQYLRRGRYVEFNLVWDQGTRFGLETDGRTESILMSLPPEARWVYDFHPEPGSEEAQTLAWLRKGIDWTTDKES